MKKLVNTSAALLISAIFLFNMFGCGGSDSSSSTVPSVVGTWEVTTTTDPDFSGGTATFNADGTYSGTQSDGTVLSGTYTQSGSNVNVNYEEYSAEGTISGNTITFNYTYPDGTTATATLTRS